MARSFRNLALRIWLSALLLAAATAQADSGWRISPERINIQVGDERRLQLLDDSANELHGAIWAVDNTKLADIAEEDGRALLRARAPGRVRVIANLRGEVRFKARPSSSAKIGRAHVLTPVT